MLTQFLATMLLLGAVLLGAVGAHWRREGIPPVLAELRRALFAWWELAVEQPFGIGLAELHVWANESLDGLATWATRLPEPRSTPATAPVLKAVESVSDYAPSQVRIMIGASKSVLAPAGTSHRFVPGVSEPFEEWRLRTWAATLHAASVELIREKKNATITGVEVLYGQLSDHANPARFPVGVS